MSDSDPSKNSDELGVFTWVKVPRRTPESGFLLDFRLTCIDKSSLGGTSDDVAPARPVGKLIGDDTAKAIDPKLLSDEVARTKRIDGPWALCIEPIAQSCGGTAYKIESGPLSHAQPWLDGVAGSEGPHEQPGCGLKWRHDDAADVLLITLVSTRACPNRNEPVPPGYAGRKAEHGVFAWIGAPKQAATSEGGPKDAPVPLFTAGFRACFTPWQPGELRGIVCPPEVLEHDVYRPSTRLVSVEVAEGRWTLWAKYGADVPKEHPYTVVCGPRSQAASWIHTREGDEWRKRCSEIALVTLTSHAIPF